MGRIFFAFRALTASAGRLRAFFARGVFLVCARAGILYFFTAFFSPIFGRERRGYDCVLRGIGGRFGNYFFGRKFFYCGGRLRHWSRAWRHFLFALYTLKWGGAWNEMGRSFERRFAGKVYSHSGLRAPLEIGAWKFCVDLKGADFNFSLIRAGFFGFWGDFLRVKLLKRNF